MDITRREAVALLDPVITLRQLTALAAIAAIPVTGYRPLAGRGHPLSLYDRDAIIHAHAQEAARTSKQFTDNDWIASALLGRDLIIADTEAGALWWPDGTRAERMSASIYGQVSAGPECVQAHRVIWIAAEGEIPPGQQVNHRNLLRWDNRRANLELVSFGNNIRHAHGKPYLTYHQAVTQLAMLPPPIPRVVPEVAGMARAGGAFHHDR